MNDAPNCAQWRARLSRILFDLRWKLVGRGQSDYRCLTCRMPADSDVVNDGPQLPLREILRRIRSR